MSSYSPSPVTFNKTIFFTTRVSLRRKRIFLQEGSVIINYRILLLALQPLGLYYINSFCDSDNGGFAFISPAKATESVCAPPSPIPAPQWSSVCAWIFVVGTSYHSVPSIISIRSAGPDCRSLACIPLELASSKALLGRTIEYIRYSWTLRWVPHLLKGLVLCIRSSCAITWVSLVSSVTPIWHWILSIWIISLPIIKAWS